MKVAQSLILFTKRHLLYLAPAACLLFPVLSWGQPRPSMLDWQASVLCRANDRNLARYIADAAISTVGLPNPWVSPAVRKIAVSLLESHQNLANLVTAELLDPYDPELNQSVQWLRLACENVIATGS